MTSNTSTEEESIQLPPPPSTTITSPLVVGGESLLDISTSSSSKDNGNQDNEDELKVKSCKSSTSEPKMNDEFTEGIAFHDDSCNRNINNRDDINGEPVNNDNFNNYKCEYGTFTTSKEDIKNENIENDSNICDNYHSMNSNNQSISSENQSLFKESINNDSPPPITSIFDRLGQTPKQSSGGGFFGMIDKVLFGTSPPSTLPTMSDQQLQHQHQHQQQQQQHQEDEPKFSPASETIGEISKGILSLALSGLENMGNGTQQFVKGNSNSSTNDDSDIITNTNKNLEMMIKEYSGYHALEKIHLEGSKSARQLKLSLKERGDSADIKEMLKEKTSFITMFTLPDNPNQEWAKLEGSWEFQYIPLIRKDSFEFASKLFNTIDESHNSLSTGSCRLKFGELVTPKERENYVHLYSLGRMLSASLFLLDITVYSIENIDLLKEFHSFLFSLFCSTLLREEERDFINDILNDAFMALVPLIKLQYL